MRRLETRLRRGHEQFLGNTIGKCKLEVLMIRQIITQARDPAFTERVRSIQCIPFFERIFGDYPGVEIQLLQLFAIDKN